ncbi:Holliday junction endonuclease [Streptomyces sp. STR69]|uniref:Holliday junction endonuclease n=1 Tax=Streptomyces sp. STR69 TaxID=1796942 RepID=UPI0021C84BC8|nr:Holliday junction endonuclease [Streptomyces sp. STR69]
MSTPSLFSTEVPAATTAAGPRPAVIGLDLSLTATGIAYADGTTATIKTKQSDGDRRLLHIAEAIQWAVGTGAGPMGSDVRPSLAVIEDIPQNSFAAKPISMVHGVVRSVLIEAGVPYVLVTAATLKAYATGKGSGDKVPMAMAAYKRAGREFADDNQCDAAWLRWAGLDWLGYAEFELPKAQKDRLAKAKWPPAVAR